MLYNVTKSLLCHLLENDRYFKLKTALINVTYLQGNCYHSTPAVLRNQKSKIDKKKRSKILEHYKLKAKVEVPVYNVWKNMTVKELALSSNRSVNDILRVLTFIDPYTNYNVRSTFEEPELLYETVKKLGAKFSIVAPPTNENEEEKEQDILKRSVPDPSVLVKRHPIITVMGHVDHGKTTLLDTLRNTCVVESEFGGITQHIGAFNVTLSNGEKITFLDTPGHAAFSAMRARGANATDIVILVVAADDGVMEQTIQSIEMAKNANVPMIIAINKIDKPEADIKRTHLMLSQHGIHVEALGGDVQSINISALKGTNLEQLIEAISAQAEIMDLKGDPTGPVEGVVIEATNDLHRGKLATALIQRGTLRKGDVLVSGLAWAKVRAMFDHAGNLLTTAGLSEAVQIIGWRELPISGDDILEVESEKRAHIVLKYRQAKIDKQKSIEQKIVADEKHQQHLVEYKEKVKKKQALGFKRLKPEGPRPKLFQEDNFPKVNIIIKADVVGSAEAILDVLETYNDEKKCKLSVVHYGVGSVTETDIELAKSFNAIIYCFNTTIPQSLSQKIKNQNIPVHRFNVIYKLIDDLILQINKKLPTIQVEQEIGVADFLKEFEINEKRKKVKVAGCRCTKGLLKKSSLFKVVRIDDSIVYNGKVSSMKHLKEEVESIKNNLECGLRFENPNLQFKSGDKIICYKMVDKDQETEWNPGF